MGGYICVHNLKRMIYWLVCLRRTRWVLRGECWIVGMWVNVSQAERRVDVDGVCSHAARGGPCIALTLFFLLTQLWQKLDWKEFDNLPEIWQGCHRITQNPLHNYSIISDPRDSMKCACEQGYPPFQQFLSRHKLRTGWKKPSQYLSMRK